jgi:hypothetical protein
MAKEFITEDDISTSYITSSEVYKLIGSVTPNYTTIGPNGYITFPGGITFEWGNVSVASGSREVNVNLPKSLSSVFQGYVSVQHPVNEGAYVAYVRSISTTTLKLYKYGSAANTLRWFVVGKV